MPLIEVLIPQRDDVLTDAFRRLSFRDLEIKLLHKHTRKTVSISAAEERPEVYLTVSGVEVCRITQEYE